MINAENFHALETLLFTHRGKVDCIYIDPPYNTGAKDWKYNNDYVEGDDLYRHSKWLALMERRLLLAKELLNPDDSVLIVTIDEKEYLRLGLLLEQMFPDARHPDGTSVISRKGCRSLRAVLARRGVHLLRRFGDQEVDSLRRNMLDAVAISVRVGGEPVDWLGLRRREPTAPRGRARSSSTRSCRTRDGHDSLDRRPDHRTMSTVRSVATACGDICRVAARAGRL